MASVRLRLLVALVPLPAAGAAACNALSGVASLHESACLADCGGPTDAGVDAGDSSVADGATEDRGAPPTPDAVAGADFCAAQVSGYRLCSDFDLSPGSVTQGFDLGLVPVPSGSGGTFDLDPSSFVSPPRSALGVANPFPAGGTSGDRLEGTLWPFGPTPPTIECNVEWNPRQVSTVSADYAHIVALTVYPDAQANNYVTNLSVQMHGDGSLVFLEAHPSQVGMDVAHTIPTAVKAGEWYAVHLSLTVSGSTTSYSVSVGGVQAPPGTLVLALPATSQVTLEIGPAYFGGATTSPSPGWTFGFDNVICL